MSDSEEDSQDRQLKMVVIGDGACGKVSPEAVPSRSPAGSPGGGTRARARASEPAAAPLRVPSFTGLALLSVTMATDAHVASLAES